MFAGVVASSGIGTIALVGADLNDPLFPAMAEGLHHAARAVGRTLLCAGTDNAGQHQAQVLESLRSSEVDAIVILPAPGSTQQLIEFVRGGPPVVVVGDVIETRNIASVLYDLEAGSRLAVEHLLNTGRRRIAVIGVAASSPVHGRRAHGLLQAITEAATAASDVVQSSPTVEGGEAALEELLHRRPDIEGVVAHNDLMAIGAIRAAEARGLRVPEDLAVIGFDDIMISSLIRPALTTVRLDPGRLVQAVAVALHQLIDAPGHHLEPVVLPAQLVVRESA